MSIKPLQIIRYALFFLATLGTASAALIQDVMVYTDGTIFYARGDIDQKIIKESTDATEVIQAALNSIGEDGGEVVIKSGRYPITKTLSLKSHTRLRGAGRSTKLMVTMEDENGCAIYLGNLKGSSVKDLEVISTTDNLAANGVVLDHCGDCKVIDIYVQDFPRYGIYLLDNSFLCEIRGCSLAGNQMAGIKMEKLRGGGRGGDYVPNLVANCIIYGGNMGIEMDYVLVANIVGCVIYQTEGYAFYMHSKSCSIVISGCRTFQIQSDAVVVEFSFEICITGNTFCWQEGNGIVLDKARWGTITGNQIIDSGSANVFDPEKHEFISYQINRKFKEEWPEDKEKVLMSGIVMRNETRGFTVSGNAIFNWPGVPWMEWGITEDETCFKNIFATNNINKAKGDISSKGKESVVGENLSHLDEAYHGMVQWDVPGQRLYQFFDTRYIDVFIEE
ncbi:MAG: right-handed parallel beta-helix repeat-containing protein [Verrucomicrobiota bacterium]